MSDRASRVQSLKDAVTDYIGKEKTRISNEVSALESILSGRTGGAGVQTSSTQVVSAVASNDLNQFLASEVP